MAATMDNLVYGAVLNIPKEFHSKDLRNYFSQFLEVGGFQCFHFKHRPERRRLINEDKDASGAQNCPASGQGTVFATGTHGAQGGDYEHSNGPTRQNCESQTTAGPKMTPATLDTKIPPKQNVNNRTLFAMCCIIRLRESKMNKLIKMYHKSNWVDAKGCMMPQICCISKIRVNDDDYSVDTDATTPTSTSTSITNVDTNEDDRLVGGTNMRSTLMNLPELNPPDIMPNGNVGTPTSVFTELIRECRLPPKVIKRLGIVFPKSRTNKRYGNVKLDYGGEVVCEGDGDRAVELPQTGRGHEILQDREAICRDEIICIDEDEVDDSVVICASTDDKPNNRILIRKECAISQDKEVICIDDNDDDNSGLAGKANYLEASCNPPSQSTTGRSVFNSPPPPKNIPVCSLSGRKAWHVRSVTNSEMEENHDESDSGEEWDRHESLHNDVTNQERTTERLFENEMEVTWDKGSSGLVFYTDAAFWDQQAGDFDEKTTDDWDVDMSAYYNESGGDRDAQDILSMRANQRRTIRHEIQSIFNRKKTPKKEQKPKRTGKKNLEDESQEIGRFEKHTKGIGRKVLESSGWVEGHGLGKSSTGISQALDTAGQTAHDKRGFGYLGKKLKPQQRMKNKKRNEHIVQQQLDSGPIVISTIYDNPEVIDPPEPFLRSLGPYHFKYRDGIRFAKVSETE